MASRISNSGSTLSRELWLRWPLRVLANFLNSILTRSGRSESASRAAIQQVESDAEVNRRLLAAAMDDSKLRFHLARFDALALKREQIWEEALASSARGRDAPMVKAGPVAPGVPLSSTSEVEAEPLARLEVQRESCSC